MVILSYEEQICWPHQTFLWSQEPIFFCRYQDQIIKSQTPLMPIWLLTSLSQLYCAHAHKKLTWQVMLAEKQLKHRAKDGNLAVKAKQHIRSFQYWTYLSHKNFPELDPWSDLCLQQSGESKIMKVCLHGDVILGKAFARTIPSPIARVSLWNIIK